MLLLSLLILFMTMMAARAYHFEVAADETSFLQVGHEQVDSQVHDDEHDLVKMHMRAASLDKLHEESVQQLEYLKADGALGMLRPVKIYTSRVVVNGSNLPALGPNEKRVHLIRHGHAIHNLMGETYVKFGLTMEEGWLHPEVQDSPLTAEGRNQASRLQAAAQALHPELIVVSPLVRATHTALLAFQHLVEGATTKVPFVAHEGCRETFGFYPCEKRTSVHELQKEFPFVDYGALATGDEDPFWSENVEEPSKMTERAYQFLVWLRNRAEREIVVSTHGIWLFTLLNEVVDCDDEASKNYFENGEMRSFIFRFEDSKEEFAANRSRI